MNKIVRRHYPVSALPDDLRREFADAREVTVTIETTEPDSMSQEDLGARERDQVMSFEDIFAQRRPPFRSAEEIMAEIREGRDDER
ncbi:hypothetical protein [Alsobacter sp. SYSU BS001988]|jgi:hypothetical protein